MVTITTPCPTANIQIDCQIGTGSHRIWCPESYPNDDDKCQPDFDHCPIELHELIPSCLSNWTIDE